MSSLYSENKSPRRKILVPNSSRQHSPSYFTDRSKLHCFKHPCFLRTKKLHVCSLILSLIIIPVSPFWQFCIFIQKPSFLESDYSFQVAYYMGTFCLHQTFLVGFFISKTLKHCFNKQIRWNYKVKFVYIYKANSLVWKAILYYNLCIRVPHCR